MRRLLSLFLLVPATGLAAQQVADSAFTVPNPDPTFEAGQGPTVCVDAAHHNFHTLDGRYYAFGELIRSDGFRTAALEQPFSPTTLAGCAVVVIANALAPANADSWELPTPPALTTEELYALVAWVREGGGLMLVIDHQPFPGTVGDLAALVGALPLNGAAAYGYFGTMTDSTMTEGAAAYGMELRELRAALGPPGRLGDHPILRGREGHAEAVRTLMTFGGSAFLPTDAMEPVLKLTAEAYGTVGTGEVPEALWPRFPMTGWVVAAARSYGEGRIVVQAEAAMCSAQLAGETERPMGMNHPMAVDNPRYCLNVVRWLAGVL